MKKHTQSFTIPGKPGAKGRPRFAKGRAYTDTKTANYEALVGWYARDAGVQKISGAVGIVVSGYWGCPKHKERKGVPYTGGWKTSRPDGDNLLKAVLDGLNGIAYEDDAQAVDSRVRTLFAAQGEEPRVEVWICAMDEETE